MNKRTFMDYFPGIIIGGFFFLMITTFIITNHFDKLGVENRNLQCAEAFGEEHKYWYNIDGRFNGCCKEERIFDEEGYYMETKRKCKPFEVKDDNSE